MKKLLFIFMSIVCACQCFGHQFKIIGGMNLSKYPHEPAIAWPQVTGLIHEPAYKPGLQGGIGIEFSLTKKIALEIDGLYFQKGTHYVYGHRKEGNKKHALDVISLPILIKFNFFQGSSPYVVYGYEYSIILSHKYKATENGRIQDVTDFTENKDHAIVFGLGYEYRKKPFSFSVEGRYHQGLQNISKGYELYPTIKTRTMVLILGLKIHL